MLASAPPSLSFSPIHLPPHVVFNMPCTFYGAVICGMETPLYMSVSLANSSASLELHSNVLGSRHEPTVAAAGWVLTSGELNMGPLLL